MPRPELDVIAFKPMTKELLIIECKSFLDSQGVGLVSFNFLDDDRGGKYKLFNKKRLRDLVFKKLLLQLAEEGALPELNEVNLRLGLACGKIKNGDESKLKQMFDERGWFLITPSEIATSVRKLANRGYENDIATIVAKILERNKP